MQERKDEELIQEFLNGDARAFEVLYERYKKQLYAYLNRLLQDQQSMADDVFQQTWMKAIRQFEKYRNREKFLAWIMRIAHNLAMDHYRGQVRRGEETLSDSDEEWIPAGPSSSPWQQLQNDELGKALEASLNGLSPELREVFLLRQDDVPFKEIAAIQNCSINTVLARMQYALKNLKKSLTQWNPLKGDEQ